MKNLQINKQGNAHCKKSYWELGEEEKKDNEKGRK